MHKGLSPEAGHHYCFAQAQPGWWCYDDSCVTWHHSLPDTVSLNCELCLFERLGGVQVQSKLQDFFVAGANVGSKRDVKQESRVKKEITQAPSAATLIEISSDDSDTGRESRVAPAARGEPSILPAQQNAGKKQEMKAVIRGKEAAPDAADGATVDNLCLGKGSVGAGVLAAAGPLVDRPPLASTASAFSDAGGSFESDRASTFAAAAAFGHAPCDAGPSDEAHASAPRGDLSVVPAETHVVKQQGMKAVIRAKEEVSDAKGGATASVGG